MARAIRVARRLGSDTSGVSLLELTIILPVLLTIGLGIMEFGNALYTYHLITVGVRDGARYLSGVAADTTLNADGINIAVKGNESGTGSNRVSWWNTSVVFVDRWEIPNINVATGAKIYRGGDTIPMVRVRTSVPYQSLGLLSYFGLGTINLTASHEERVYGNR